MTRASAEQMVEQVAQAVLYEGYLLYPYRPSALKNRQRWSFGGLCPRAYSEAQSGNEPWRSQSECLLMGGPETSVEIKLRFLHLVNRQAASISGDVGALSNCQDSDFHFVEALEIDGRLFQTWQEAVEGEFVIPAIPVQKDLGAEQRFEFHFRESKSVEPLRDSRGKIAGAFVRTQNALDGAALVRLESLRDSLFKLTLHVLNLTPFPGAPRASRDEAMLHSLASQHAVLNVLNGEFVSLLDPPGQFAEFASDCRNVGSYPVLIGNEADRSTMLCSPVILYDYPQVSPESAGDLFDGTEIDEILTLRILALTEREKAEMRQCDERARRILERIEGDPRHLARLHGAIRKEAPHLEREVATGKSSPEKVLNEKGSVEHVQQAEGGRQK